MTPMMVQTGRMQQQKRVRLKASDAVAAAAGTTR